MAKRSKDRSGRYVSRGGDKLEVALSSFEVSVSETVAADLGANVGGFTDCLLQHGAAKVYAVETGYGVLDWKLRNDKRVGVMERTNSLRVVLPEPVDLVVADVGWTSLLKVVPKALEMLKGGGVCIALLKPQYEVDSKVLVDGHVSEEQAVDVSEAVVAGLREEGCKVSGIIDPAIESRGRNPERFLRVDKASNWGL